MPELILIFLYSIETSFEPWETVRLIYIKMAELREFDRMFRLDGKVALVTGGS
jgi:hypothetical protein